MLKIRSGQEVCFGPSRPDPGSNVRDQDSGSSERGRCRRGRSELPHFPSKLQSFALVPGEQAKNEEKRRKAKKNEKKRRKTKKNEKAKKNEKKRKKWENSSDPIYTNPIKNLPKDGTRTGRDGPHLGTWTGPKHCKTKHRANLDGTASDPGWDLDGPRIGPRRGSGWHPQRQ